MSFALKVQSEAIIDIQEGFEWYEMQKEGLGFEFIEEIENGFEKICNQPQFYTSISPTFRRFKIERFPYLIVYEIEDNAVIVNSVRHGSQKPNL
ncbi:MAG TPA: type II toxin-antitoxin system RelE/ParE family toxin [Hanamia sp.]|nr:type II toxin-antitoxin system RelE/ParE family toxin [Hanamia sp.]